MCYKCRHLIEECKPALHPQCQQFYDRHLSNPEQQKVAIDAFNKSRATAKGEMR